MIQIASLRWKSEATQEQIATVGPAVREFTLGIEGVNSFVGGADLGAGGANNYDFAMITTFADRSAWECYMSHPGHKPTSNRYTLPITAKVGRRPDRRVDMPGNAADGIRRVSAGPPGRYRP